MRSEFSAKVKVAAFDRAGGHCEKCTAPLRPGKYDYDHIIPDALGGSALLDNCAVLCRSCHSGKTCGRDIPVIAKSRRIQRRHRGIQGRSKFRGWRKMNGTIVYAKNRQ